jgi:hypothetical protein
MTRRLLFMRDSWNGKYIVVAEDPRDPGARCGRLNAREFSSACVPRPGADHPIGPKPLQDHAYVNGGVAESKLETLPEFFRAHGYPTGRCSVE